MVEHKFKRYLKEYKVNQNKRFVRRNYTYGG